MRDSTTSQSIKSDRISKSSIARMAGNIAGPIAAEAYSGNNGIFNAEQIASESVRLARLIAAEIEAEGKAAPHASKTEERK